MPTTRKRRTRNYQGVLSEAQEEYLIYGLNISGSTEGASWDFPFKNEEERKSLYVKHRDYLFSKSEPGKKPDAYWDYEEDRDRE
jgi:hypothetical protein